MLLRKLYYVLPVKWRFVFRRIVFLPQDLFTASSRKKLMVPPKGLMFIGGGDFVETGKRLAGRLRQHVGLNSKSKVLDIGCGIGRLARALTFEIKEPGFYEGFDVVKTGIDWCKKNISTQYSNFNFKLALLQNDLYTDEGGEASLFVFPYKDNTFDIAIATSLFTHMLPDEVEQYLKETFRVLDKGGFLYATFFCGELEQKRNDVYDFKFKYNGYALMNNQVKRANVLYDPTYLANMFNKTGFEVETFVQGRWSNPKAEDLQDTYILKKR